jgi:hypothetical protein
MMRIIRLSATLSLMLAVASCARSDPASDVTSISVSGQGGSGIAMPGPVGSGAAMPGPGGSDAGLPGPGGSGAGLSGPAGSGTGLPGPAGSDGGLPPAMRPNVARPDARATELKAVRWARIEAAAGRDVLVHYTMTGRGDCAALGRVDVVETDTAVTVTVWLGRLLGADCDGPQPAIAAAMTTTVTLARPLANRPVHDGAPT